MAVPLRQSVRVGTYLMKQRLTRTEKFPLLVELEPLFQCNLECAGCGKIDYPAEILNQRLSVAECLEAVDECGAPVVVIARVGTTSAWLAVAVVTEILALWPSRRPAGGLVMETVTG